MTDNTFRRAQGNGLYLFAVIIGVLGLLELFDPSPNALIKSVAYVLVAVAAVTFAWSEQREARQIRWAAWAITIAALALLAYLELFWCAE